MREGEDVEVAETGGFRGGGGWGCGGRDRDAGCGAEELV